VFQEDEMIYWRKSHDFEIVNLLDSGHTPKQVALDLAISIWTVYRACRRFHVKQKAQKNAKHNAGVFSGSHVK
jgi:FixJ family two-component response regulator